MTTLYSATKSFLNDPKSGRAKIIPFIKSKLIYIERRGFEKFNISKLSKPYSGHNALMSNINFNDGFYIVCGGNDGYMSDPTYYLEKFCGWTGIIIEPLPKAAVACRKNRPKSIIIETALVSDSFSDKEINIIDCNYMSLTATSEYDINDWVDKGERAQNLTAKNIIVPANTLDDVLDNNKPIPPIDLLVIDVEGSEKDVLDGFNLEKFKPKYILIELHTEALKQAVESIFNNRYLLMQQVDTADYLYRREEI